MTAGNEKKGVIIVDHGSRRPESNQMLHEVAAMFQADNPDLIVEPAHMELASPSIPAAFGACVDRGAKSIVVHPFFLFPGRHWHQDIPNLTAAAAESYPGIRFLVTAPLGAHPLMTQIMQDRIGGCCSTADGEDADCQFCESAEHCRWQTASTESL